jgi:hypothetical protein
MATKQIPAEITNFVKGFITDVNPMSFPEGASLDEENMVIKLDGTRSRRLGMDFETNYALYDTPPLRVVDGEYKYNSYKWANAAGIPNLNLAVFQINNFIAIYDTTNPSLSQAGPIFTYTFTEDVDTISFSSVDGILVAATGAKAVYYFEYDEENNTISMDSFRLLIRDTFGVECVIGGINYREGSNVARRPKSITDEHMYNLRNQTFGYPRLGGLPFYELVIDPIAYFNDYSVTTYPSNADSVLDALYPNTESPIDPITDRFNPKELTSNPPGTVEAPRGFFIIDAIDRGTSRIAEIEKLYSQKQTLQGRFKPQTLPADSSVKGATALAQFAGRMFYAGFSSEIVDGDAHSPRLGSYVLFSKLIESAADLKACYQQGDPTSKNYSELLATDGGFIRLDGAYNIVALVPVSQGLIALAENGIWLISGEDRGQFKATSYATSKLSSTGCNCKTSVVRLGDSVWYWSTEGIYAVEANQFGDLVANNKSRGRIQKYFDKIDAISKKRAVGFVDTYDRTIRWLYDNQPGPDPTMELVYNIDFDAFTKNKIIRPDIEGGRLTPIVAVPITVPPFSYGTVFEGIQVGVDPVIVTIDAVDVSVGVTTSSTSTTVKETKYLVLTTVWEDSAVQYTFAAYSDVLHTDWLSYYSSEDAEAFLLTGWSSGGDYQRRKQLPFLTMHFYKTEDGFTESGTDFIVSNPSSCIMQTQWDWSNSANSGKWGNGYQVYRFKRHYMPNDISDAFDNGFATVETRNKLRGSGKVLSMLFSSEPQKHMDIIGWSLVMEIANGV